MEIHETERLKRIKRFEGDRLSAL